MEKENSKENAKAATGSSNEEPLSPKEAAEIRHDEEVTGSGIVRSLFMANEPAQRMEVDEAQPDEADQDS
ncbi:hypothetical protein [Haloferula rosea]|uniref:Uncharacterized protein n=1 Tax=Haloferula rosea TaxID=490093 RepID=A0A934VEL5_9BACT|nr:hypothetical protein [Haloferula rosea]MBK1825650.1 hypothetical protein [Haloferula rosea]